MSGPEITKRDAERIGRIQDALRAGQLDAVMVSLPRHVLLLTGYCPVVGASIALCSSDGEVGLLAPQDEQQFVMRGWADHVEYFQPASLDKISSLSESVLQPLRKLISRFKFSPAQAFGISCGLASQPSPYAAMHIFGEALRSISAEVLRGATLVQAENLLERLSSVKTERELSRIRTACAIASGGMENGRANLVAGHSEMEIAAALEHKFAAAAASAGLDRQHAFLHCMSGPNSAHAHYAYAHSSLRRLGKRDLALIHCNSHVDGYWTDITRTYCLDDPEDQQKRMFQAVLEARDAAIQMVRPGARASEVDQAARRTIEKHGFRDAFKHSTGHGVGFEAINAGALPRIHPASDDVLEAGMVFNIEPAIYLEGFGGVRHCDMVAVHSSGAELLTSFHSGIEQVTGGRQMRAA